jgi:hypothetical protein
MRSHAGVLVKKTLYLFRKPLDQINSAVFLPSDSQGDVVFLEGSGGGMFPYAGGVVYSLTDDRVEHVLTYDELVNKIFECDHTVVV